MICWTSYHNSGMKLGKECWCLVNGRAMLHVENVVVKREMKASRISVRESIVIDT